MNKKETIFVVFEYATRAFLGVLVASFAAIYYGPNEFGEISYVLAVFAMVSSLTRFGLEASAQKEIAQINNKINISNYISTAKLAIYLSSVSFSVPLYFFGGNFGVSKSFSVAIFLGLISQVGILYEAYAITHGMTINLTRYKLYSVIISSALRVPLILMGFGIEVYVAAQLIMTYAHNIPMARALKGIGINAKIFDFRKKYFEVIFRPSFYLVITSLSATLYMKADQIIIGHYLGSESLGVYSFGIRVYEAWVLLPISLANLQVSKINKVLNSEVDVEKNLSLLMATYIWPIIIFSALGSIVSILIYFFSAAWVYKESMLVLSLAFLVTVPAAFGFIGTRVMIQQNLEKYVATRVILTAVINIGLNIFLINIFGIIGSVVAIFLSLIFCNLIIDRFSDKTKMLAISKSRAIFDAGIVLSVVGGFFPKKELGK